MNVLKRMMVALLALLPLATGMAFAENEHGYSRIFIFGASFMDSGNHFADTGITAHPPFDLIPYASYGVGGHRHTNGHTWVEVLAQDMGLNKSAKPAYRNPVFGNYAYGYGRAREVADPAGDSLSAQVQYWQDNGYCTGIPMEDTLFIVDSGYADLFDIMLAPDQAAILAIMGEMTASIGNNIGILYGCGARNLLFAYLMPAEAAPITKLMPAPPEPPPISLTEIYNGWFLKPMPFDQRSRGPTVRSRQQRALLRIPVFLGAWVAAFAWLPVWIPTLALVAWVAKVTPGIRSVNARFQNVGPNEEPA